jgi:hypothetical protein
MITNVSITRGVNNLPFDQGGIAQSYDVTFSVTNLSAAVSTPYGTMKKEMMTAVSGEHVEQTPDEDTAIFEYLSAIAGQGLLEQVHAVPQARLAFAIKYKTFTEFFTPGHMASLIHQHTSSGVLGSSIGLPGKLYGAFADTSVLER